jgi:hypothetical protein
MISSSFSAVADRRFRDRIVRPVFIVSSPRSGSTLLFETLAKAPELFSTGRESHMRIEQVADFHPARRGWTSNRLEHKDATPNAVEELAKKFYTDLRDGNGSPAKGDARLLEKTPKNALRVPFFNAAWSDSVFVYLYRDPRQTLASMMEAWLSGRFVTYPRLPGWGSPPWSLLLVPQWRELIGRSLHEVVARQWATTTDFLLSDLSGIGKNRVVAIDYQQFLANPQSTMLSLTRCLDLEWKLELASELPLSRHTYSPPAADKWRRLQTEIESVWSLVEDADAKGRAFLETHGI